MKEIDRIFILGSGFSKSFSQKMPTIKDLTVRLFKLKNPEYKNLTHFVQHLYKVSNNLPDFKHIENITSIIFSKQIFKDFEEEMDYEILKFELIKFIYNEIKHPKLDAAKADTLYDFLKYCSYQPPQKEAKQLIITFNYDLIIEDIIKNKIKNGEKPVEVKYGLKFEKYESRDFTSESREKSFIEILKLHGSFNWFRAKGSDTNDIRNIYLLDDEENMYSIHKNDIPTYIPMAHIKGLFLNGTLYSTLWARAIDSLNRAKEIFFIGYGFPQTDLNNLGFFLDYRDKIKFINVREPKETVKLKRLYRLFGKEMIKNMDAKKFIENEILKV